VETLILTVLALGLGVALCSPVSVVTVIVLLTMPAGRRRAIAFVAGWLLAIVIIGLVSLFVLHGANFSSHKSTPSRAASILEIVVGALTVLVSLRALRRRREAAAGTPETPKWVDRLDRTNWLLGILVGAFMLTYSLTLAAAAEILKANVSRVDAVIAFVVFSLASITTIAAPIVLVVVRPEHSQERLAAWRRWLLGNSRTIGLAALLVIGALLVARGIHDLVA